MRSMLAFLAFAAAGSAQTLTTTELALGNEVEFRIASAAPGGVALLLVGTSGLGSGTCFPAPIGLCLDLLEPVATLATLPLDAQGSATLTFVMPFGVPQVTVHAQALVARLAPTLVVTKTNTTSDGIVGLDGLGDSFDGTALSPRWRVHNPQIATSTVANGELTLQTVQGGPAVTWYADGEGFLLWKRVTGDFTCTASVVTDDPTNPGQPPAANYMLGGLTIRDADAQQGQHDWLHVTVGGGSPPTVIAVEDKTTRNSVSDLLLHPIAQPRGEIRIQRQGTQVSLWYRTSASASWTLLRSHARPDLPATVQVGPQISAWQNPPNLRVRFASVTFSR